MVLTVRDLAVDVDTHSGTAKVLNGISLEISRGETLGLVGETGSGKSTLIMALMGLLAPAARVVAGQVNFEGHDLLAMSEDELQRLRGKQLALIMQNARSALDPLATVGNQIASVISAHTGADRRGARAAALEMIRRVRLPDVERVARARPDELSGGMAQRISIAMALAGSPKLLLADDPTSGLDVTVQAQVLEVLSDLARSDGLSTLLVTRDLGIVAHYCDRVAVIYAGRIVEVADTRTFFREARHPYSISLLGSVSYRKTRAVAVSEGVRPHLDLKSLPSGCLFNPICAVSQAACSEHAPDWDVVDGGHFVRCHRWREARSLVTGDAA